MLMMLAQFFVALADITVAGRIAPGVQASLGLISVSVFFFLVVATAMANGAVSVISQSVGAGLPLRARRYGGFVLLLAVGLGGLFTLTFSQFRTAFLSLLQVPESIFPVAGYFLDIYLYVLPGYYVLLTTNAVFQANRMVRLPLYSMCLITVLNAVMDIGLGLGMWGLPDMGYKGVAWATFGSVMAGATLNIVSMQRAGLLRRSSFPPIRWMRRAQGRLFRCAWPAGASQVLWQGSYLALYAFIGMLAGNHVDSLAGFSAGLRIDSILTMPAFALNLTASILVGQALGARRKREATRIALRITGLGCITLSVAALCVWLARDPITTFITPDPAVRAQTLTYLAYSLSATPFTVGAMILGGVMIGAGATLYNMTAFFLAAWLIRLPLAHILGNVLAYNVQGIWAALLVSHICHFGCLMLIVLRARWQAFAMRSNTSPRP